MLIIVRFFRFLLQTVFCWKQKIIPPRKKVFFAESLQWGTISDLTDVAELDRPLVCSSVLFRVYPGVFALKKISLYPLWSPFISFRPLNREVSILCCSMRTQCSLLFAKHLFFLYLCVMVISKSKRLIFFFAHRDFWEAIRFGKLRFSGDPQMEQQI